MQQKLIKNKAFEIRYCLSDSGEGILSVSNVTSTLISPPNLIKSQIDPLTNDCSKKGRFLLLTLNGYLLGGNPPGQCEMCS